MEYCSLKGFLLVLLLQDCTSEGQPSSIQSSTVSVEDIQILPNEQEPTPAEVVPVVAPPSLKKVQQAVQEATEQVEGRGAEEVLKDLLERVVEAALGQVDAGRKGKSEATLQEQVEEDAVEAEKGESETATVAEVMKEEIDVTTERGVTGVREEQEVAEMSEGTAEEGEGVGEGETVGKEAVEVIDESLDTGISLEVVEETVAAEKEKAVEEARVEDPDEQAVLTEGERAAEPEPQEETPADVEVAVGREAERETVVESDLSLGAIDVEQIEDVWGVGERETQVDEMEGEVITMPSDYDTTTTQTVADMPAEKEEINSEKDIKVEDSQVHFIEDGEDPEEAEERVVQIEQSQGGEKDIELVIKEESEDMVNVGVDQQGGQEEQITSKPLHGSEKPDHEPEDDADASKEQSPEMQSPTLSSSLGEVEAGENAPTAENSDHGKKIITPTDNLMPHDSDVVTPTLDNLVKDVLAMPPQVDGEEPGEANELVEDTAGTTDTSELPIEAWKIGAIAAAVLLVLETIVIIIYILKRHNKSSSLALQRSCEEGCVEPEAATGGDCSDDTLSANNGDTQPKEALDLPDAESTLAQNNEEQHEEEHAMSNLPPSSTEESDEFQGAESSQVLRTSML